MTNDLTTRVAKLLWAKIPAPQRASDEIDEAARAVVALVHADLARPKVKPLVWDDFDGMGAKASGFYQANYLITIWRGRGQFEVAMSYPGYQTGFDGERFHDTLKAAKAAAQADYEARILSALVPALGVEP